MWADAYVTQTDSLKVTNKTLRNFILTPISIWVPTGQSSSFLGCKSLIVYGKLKRTSDFILLAIHSYHGDGKHKHSICCLLLDRNSPWVVLYVKLLQLEITDSVAPCSISNGLRITVTCSVRTSTIWVCNIWNAENLWMWCSNWYFQVTGVW